MRGRNGSQGTRMRKSSLKGRETRGTSDLLFRILIDWTTFLDSR